MPYDPNDPGAEGRERNRQALKWRQEANDKHKAQVEAQIARESKEQWKQMQKGGKAGKGCALLIGMLTLSIAVAGVAVKAYFI
jgi:phage gp16-like protein